MQCPFSRRCRCLPRRCWLLRRPATTEAEEEEVTRISDAGLVIDRAKREVRLDGRLVDLTTAEFDLLWILATHAGRPLSREDLFQLVRGIPYDGIDRSIDMRVSQLRRALKRGRRRRDWIKTVRGVGYQFVLQET